MKAFRPSACALREDEEGIILQRMANAKIYARRASEGLPIFPEESGQEPKPELRRITA